MASIPRRAFRAVVPSLAAAALITTAAAELPADLPSVALESELLFRLERALALLYGGLLMAVPLIRGARGELPIEVSARGARYEEASRTLIASEASVAELDARLDAAIRRLDDQESDTRDHAEAIRRLGEQRERREDGR